MSKTGIRKGKDFVKNMEKLKKIYGGKIPKNLSIDDADKTLKNVTPIKKNSGGCLTEGIKKVKAKTESMLSGGQAKLDKNKELNPIVKNNFIFFILSPFIVLLFQILMDLLFQLILNHQNVLFLYDEFLVADKLHHLDKR